jgi:hypothetical protein
MNWQWHSKACRKLVLVGALCTCVASINFPERYEPPDVGRTAGYFFTPSPELKPLIRSDLKRGYGVFDVDHGHGSSGATGPAFHFATT